ncbi:unnamed protein product [Spirodela intermedia]|uniref:Uncharacterized protein n=1 Tax=Spirodela intermedia TaxID=51605 RepID=A0A7I8JIT1_SPIIN|nr:unnamed protein product [Spirodela intermedia]CAA6669831.1 unnamed protein product [Spirodela intermedia]
MKLPNTRPPPSSSSPSGDSRRRAQSHRFSAPPGRGHCTTILPNAQDSGASPTHRRRDAGTLFSCFQFNLCFI